MNIMTIIKQPYDYSQLFRIPSVAERQLGLWIDRIGAAKTADIREKMRVLGLYGIVQIVEGEGYFVTDQHPKKDVMAGDCLFLFPAIAHAYGNYGNSWFTRWIVFGGVDAKKFEQLGYLSPEHHIIRDRTQIFTNTFEKLARGLMGKNDKTAYLERYTLLCTAITGFYTQREYGAVQNANEQLVSRVSSYIDTNYSKKLQPPLIAERFHISYTHLRRIFKQYTGYSITEYIRNKRIEYAKSLLTSCDWPVKRIAREVGYDDELYFMRLFKSVVGMSPRQFGGDRI